MSNDILIIDDFSKEQLYSMYETACAEKVEAQKESVRLKSDLIKLFTRFNDFKRTIASIKNEEWNFSEYFN